METLPACKSDAALQGVGTYLHASKYVPANEDLRTFDHPMALRAARAARKGLHSPDSHKLAQQKVEQGQTKKKRTGIETNEEGVDENTDGEGAQCQGFKISTSSTQHQS